MPNEPQGNGAPQAPQGTGTPEGSAAEPKFVTEEQLNRAITARFADFSKKQQASLDTFQGSFKSTFEQEIGGIKTMLEGFKPPPPAPDPKAKPADTPAPALAETPEIKELRKQLEKLTTKASEAEKREAAAVAKQRDGHLRQRTVEELTKRGLDPMRAKLALSHIVDSQRLVRYGEDGETLLFGADGDDLATGITAFLGTEEGKLLVPARGVQGSGGSAGKLPPRPNGDAPPTLTQAVASLLGAR